MLEPFAEQDEELVLRESGIEVRPRDGVEPEVPGGEPRVLPRVGHREHVERVEVAPAAVAAVPVGLRRRRLAGVAVEPAAHVVGVHLLAPDEPGAGLAEHPHRLRRRAGRSERGVELVRVRLAGGDHLAERGARPGGPRLPGRPVQPQPQLGFAAARHRHPVAKGGLRAEPVGVDRRGPGDDVVVDPVLRIRRGRLRAVEARGVRLVLAEQRLRRLAVGAGRPLEPVAGERVLGHGERRAVALDPRPRRQPGLHDQVFRNQRVGSTSRVASSGPWFSISIRASTSVGEAFA